MLEPKPLNTFLTALSGRDFALLATCLSPAARARLLLPRGPEEISGRDPIARRLEGWFAPATEFEVLSTNSTDVGTRHRLTWRFRTLRPGRPREVVEQVAFCDLGREGIEKIDLMCSGFLPDEMPASCDLPQAQVFEAGAMGCADGLAEEFRRRLAGVAVGDSLRVVVRDPAAKEDLPALARMLGQAVTSTEAHDDGRLTINVERRR